MKVSSRKRPEPSSLQRVTGFSPETHTVIQEDLKRASLQQSKETVGVFSASDDTLQKIFLRKGLKDMMGRSYLFSGILADAEEDAEVQISDWILL